MHRTTSYWYVLARAKMHIHPPCRESSYRRVLVCTPATLDGTYLSELPNQASSSIRRESSMQPLQEYQSPTISSGCPLKFSIFSIPYLACPSLFVTNPPQPWHRRCLNRFCDHSNERACRPSCSSLPSPNRLSSVKWSNASYLLSRQAYHYRISPLSTGMC